MIWVVFYVFYTAQVVFPALENVEIVEDQDSGMMMKIYLLHVARMEVLWGSKQVPSIARYCIHNAEDPPHTFTSHNNPKLESTQSCLRDIEAFEY